MNINNKNEFVKKRRTLKTRYLFARYPSIIRIKFTWGKLGPYY